MRLPFRRSAGFLLALSVALTSVTMALARGQTHDAAGQVILCSGAGIVQLQVDAEGNPIGPAHICPDCALGGLDLVQAPIARPLPGPGPERLSFVIETVAPTGFDRSEPRARGPPPV